jgi:serine/threonine-protein kinase
VSRFRTEPLLPKKDGDGAPGSSPPSELPLSHRPTEPRQEQPLSHRPTEHAPSRAPLSESDRATLKLDPATRPPPPRILTGKVLANRYELGTRLGVGGMGEVYRATHLALGVDVAVKVMHPHVAAVDEYTRRFRREAHATSLLHHRNVVRVLDFGEEDGLLFIVMELLKGETLSQLLGRFKTPPPLEECIEIYGQVLDAFEAAHAAGIVHRDLKTENVFLTIEADGKRIAKVVDFGLAHVDDYRDAGPTLTQQDVVSGTPEYMSPEQCRSLQVGPSTDIYALGCLLTEMLQLAPPFKGNPVEVMTQQMFVPPPPLRRPEGSPPVPPLLERLRLSLLAKSPEMRPRDIREIRDRLREAMSAEATAARLPDRKADLGAGRGELRAPDRLSGTPSAAGATIGLVRLSNADEGVSASCTTGLSAQGIAWTLGLAPAGGGPLSAVVLDAGPDVDAAAAWLRDKAPRMPVLVCLQDVTTERMNALIAAGAKDIVPYPVTSDVLGRKIKRATRVR